MPSEPIQARKPSAKEAAAEEKAQLARPPSQTFLFNSSDLKKKPPLPFLVASNANRTIFRSLAPIYANEGRRRLHAIFKSKVKNILANG